MPRHSISENNFVMQAGPLTVLAFRESSTRMAAVISCGDEVMGRVRDLVMAGEAEDKVIKEILEVRRK